MNLNLLLYAANNNSEVLKDLVTTLDCARQCALSKNYDGNLDEAVKLNVEEILNTLNEIRKKYEPTGAIPKRFSMIGNFFDHQYLLFLHFFPNAILNLRKV